MVSDHCKEVRISDKGFALAVQPGHVLLLVFGGGLGHLFKDLALCVIEVMGLCELDHHGSELNTGIILKIVSSVDLAEGTLGKFLLDLVSVLDAVVFDPMNFVKFLIVFLFVKLN